MNDAAGSFEQETGPSWARPNWPLSELDELNLGLDPTQATIEKIKSTVAEKVAATGASSDEVRRAGASRVKSLLAFVDETLPAGHGQGAAAVVASQLVGALQLAAARCAPLGHGTRRAGDVRHRQCWGKVGHLDVRAHA